MIDTSEALVSGLVEAAQLSAQAILKEAGGLVPFGLACRPDGQVSQVLAGQTVMEAAKGDLALLLKYEAFLNMTMRNRARDDGLATVGLATRRETVAGTCMVLQIEFRDRTFVIALPLEKRMFGGWSFGKPVPVGEAIFPAPHDGGVAPVPPEGTLENAFAPTPAGDGFVHRVSGFRFPARVGDFEAADLAQSDPAGLDVAVAYNHLSLEKLSVTAFVYPDPAAGGTPLASHFESCKRDVTTLHASARLLFEDRAQLAGDRNGKLCVYRLKDRIEGRDIESVSELWLFPFEQRFLKYRASYDPALRTTAPAAVKTLVESLAWPQSQPSTARAEHAVT